MPRVITVIVVLLVLTCIAGLVVMYGGYYNVAATKKHNALTFWVLDETMENSIKHNAKGITAPDLSDSNMIRTGFEHYDHMCRVCHGAPGIMGDEFAAGLYPKPPSLMESAPEWTSAELFWTIKNGIKMTGMPAFDVTHTDEKIWVMVSFVRILPDLNHQDYLGMRSEEPHGEEKGED